METAARLSFSTLVIATIAVPLSALDVRVVPASEA
jgi:hypothetical protein